MAHSPLGASSAERWMECPGSVALIKRLELPDTDEPEYRAAGTAAHEALAKCLTEGLDAWEVLDQPMSNGIVVSEEMMQAVNAFLTVARPLTQARDGYSPGVPYIEHPMAAPQFHPLFYGTVDFGIVGLDNERTVLNILDFKYGEGLVVEAHENPQIMYYAYGLLLMHPEVDLVRMQIIQPRITWHTNEPFECSAEYLRNWAEGTLRPAMVATEIENGLKPGEHCRFCPAKLICPVLTHLFGAAAAADPRELVQFGDADIDRNYPLIFGAKQYIKALEAETFRRLQLGGDQWEHVKLVQQKANRVWKPDAKAMMVSRFGDDAWTERDLKSPAEMEKIGEGAKALVREYAYKPETGLTVALMDDPKAAVKVRPPSADFPATPKETGQ